MHDTPVSDCTVNFTIDELTVTYEALADTLNTRIRWTLHRQTSWSGLALHVIQPIMENLRAAYNEIRFAIQDVMIADPNRIDSELLGLINVPDILLDELNTILAATTWREIPDHALCKPDCDVCEALL